MATMVKYCIPVPAEKASIKLFDKIYITTVTPDYDTDLSSFGSEIFDIQKMISCRKYSLLLLDELSKGTNPYEGKAIFHSVMQYLSKKRKKVVVATTHFDVPTDVANLTHYQMIGLSKECAVDLVKNYDLYLFDKLQIITNNVNYQPMVVDNTEPIPHTAVDIAELLGLEKKIIDLIREKIKS
jgi:DNA mismatch repair ATPase MutS